MVSATPRSGLLSTKNNPSSSRIRGFYKLNRGEKLDALQKFTGLPLDQIRILGKDGALDYEICDLFVENALGSYPLPFGICTSFKINKHDYIIPMAVEESSVIAATSNAARLVYNSGGFEAETLSNLMIGQIHIVNLDKQQISKAVKKLTAHKQSIIAKANQVHPRLLARGGGCKDIEILTHDNAPLPFLTLHVLIDTCEAMGANLINTICEDLSPYIQSLSQGRISLRILSNLADKKLYRARCRLAPELLAQENITGQTTAQRIVEACTIANCDPYRAATNNKGIMNGVDPVVIATGNDWRAIESGAHAYAALSGNYQSLSQWSLDSQGFLCGELTLPLQLGTVGGITRLHPLAKLSLKILKNPSANRLGEIITCSGLAANLAALNALVSTGIQKGHMKLHAKNVALAAGALAKEIEIVARIMVEQSNISAGFAETILTELRKQDSDRLDIKELLSDISF